MEGGIKRLVGGEGREWKRRGGMELGGKKRERKEMGEERKDGTRRERRGGRKEWRRK